MIQIIDYYEGCFGRNGTPKDFLRADVEQWVALLSEEGFPGLTPNTASPQNGDQYL